MIVDVHYHTNSTDSLRSLGLLWRTESECLISRSPLGSLLGLDARVGLKTSQTSFLPLLFPSPLFFKLLLLFHLLLLF